MQNPEKVSTKRRNRKSMKRRKCEEMEKITYKIFVHNTTSKIRKYDENHNRNDNENKREKKTKRYYNHKFSKNLLEKKI